MYQDYSLEFEAGGPVTGRHNTGGPEIGGPKTETVSEKDQLKNFISELNKKVEKYDNDYHTKKNWESFANLALSIFKEGSNLEAFKKWVQLVHDAKQYYSLHYVKEGKPTQNIEDPNFKELLAYIIGGSDLDSRFGLLENVLVRGEGHDAYPALEDLVKKLEKLRENRLSIPQVNLLVSALLAQGRPDLVLRLIVNGNSWVDKELSDSGIGKKDLRDGGVNYLDAHKLREIIGNMLNSYTSGEKSVFNLASEIVLGENENKSKFDEMRNENKIKFYKMIVDFFSRIDKYVIYHPRIEGVDPDKGEFIHIIKTTVISYAREAALIALGEKEYNVPSWWWSTTSYLNKFPDGYLKALEPPQVNTNNTTQNVTDKQKPDKKSQKPDKKRR